LQIANYELRNTSYELRITNNESRVIKTNYKLFYYNLNLLPIIKKFSVNFVEIYF